MPDNSNRIKWKEAKARHKIIKGSVKHLCSWYKRCFPETRPPNFVHREMSVREWNKRYTKQEQKDLIKYC